MSTALTSCSENEATGKRQFTALMPASQEASIGAEEHDKAIAQYGVYGDQNVQNYVRNLGQKLAAQSERKDVSYTFTVLDSPVINAFALPGGYVYVTRGLMAWANSEAELAAVMAHEIGHVNARHSAARYSQAALTQLGLQVLSATVSSPGAGEIANLGANLYLAQYSQSQEYESDSLGMRYASRAGYDPRGMAIFLQQLARNDAYEKRGGQGLNQFFSSHPSTPARVQRAAGEAGQYQGGGTIGTVEYLRLLNGMTYGDGAGDGYVSGRSFIHPQLGFGFDAPSGFTLQNNKEAVIGQHPDGITMIFDMAKKESGQKIGEYLFNSWSGGHVGALQDTTIGGLPAATAVANQAELNGKAVSLRLVAIQASPTTVYRFQYAIPLDLANNERLQNDILTSARSFHTLSDAEKKTDGQRIAIVAAKSGDTAQSIAGGMDPNLFYAINGLDGGAPLQTGTLYKIVK